MIDASWGRSWGELEAIVGELGAAEGGQEAGPRISSGSASNHASAARSYRRP
jgi:hypothetical protein